MVRSLRVLPLLCLVLLSIALGPVRADEKAAAGENNAAKEEQNVLIIGRSSMAGLPGLVAALLASHQTPMNVDEGPFLYRRWEEVLRTRKVWHYVVMDAWQFKEGGTDPPGFPDAVAAFAKQVRGHSPQCKIILFPWWIPAGRDATNEGVMKVFERCVEAARQNDLWVATTGPAFMEARLARRDLRITVSDQDAHPGIHGSYLNACSLFAILTGQSPAGLPATLKPRGGRELTIPPEDAKYLQELAWKVYQRELKQTKPAKM